MTENARASDARFVPEYLVLRPEQLLEDPGASYWLKNALRQAITKDPVDAANEAELLASVLRYRAEEASR